LVGKTKGKTTLGRPEGRWDDNIRIDFRDTALEGVDWMHLTEDRDQWWALVNTVMNLRFSKTAWNLLTS
jgi:hypothetical protein